MNNNNLKKISVIVYLTLVITLISSNAIAQDPPTNCSDLELLANQSTFSKDSYGIANYNGETYVGGWLDMKKIVNDTYVNIPEVEFGGSGGSIKGMKEINNRLYFWGYGIIINGTNTNLGYYDGANFVALPFVGTSNKDIWNVIEYTNNTLIAIGDFDGNPSSDLQVFNDTGIVGDLGGLTTVTGYSGTRASLYYNGHLFVGGWFSQAGTTPVFRVAHYDGTNWDDMGVNSSNSSNQSDEFLVTALYPYSSDQIMVSGYFYEIGGITTTFIALYNFNTGVWSPFQAPAIVQDFEIYKGSLYIGTTYGIWRWNPGLNFWEEINAISRVFDMEVSPDGEYMQCVSGGNTFYLEDGTAFTNEPIKFSCESIVSVVDINARESDISVYPNPASDHISIHGLENLQNYSLEIMGINGETVKRYPSISNGRSLDISSLQKGVYFLRFSDTNKRLVRKLIVLPN